MERQTNIPVFRTPGALQERVMHCGLTRQTDSCDGRLSGRSGPPEERENISMDMKYILIDLRHIVTF